MKKLIILLLISTSIYSQTEYVSFQFDVNNLLELKDNDRMNKQVNGLDFDIEAGAISKDNIGLGIYYGQFYNANYHEYGVVLDKYFKLGNKFLVSVGNRYNTVIRTKKQKHLGTTASYINPRIKISYDMSYLIVEFVSEFTNRKDINKRIYEGGIGIRYNFKQ